ncbi:MAG: YdcF family protein, partial [Pseudomonadota bacterium]
ILLGVPLAAALALGAGFVLFLSETRLSPVQPLETTDGIAVLTGGAERVETGLRLVADGHARLLLVTGANREARRAEVLAAAGFDAEALASRVTLGRAAATTRGNAAEIAAWVAAERLGSVRLVTSGYHMPRARLEVTRALPAGVRVVAHPVQARVRDGAWRRWSLLGSEYAKYLAARLGISALIPARGDARER